MALDNSNKEFYYMGEQRNGVVIRGKIELEKVFFIFFFKVEKITCQ